MSSKRMTGCCSWLMIRLPRPFPVGRPPPPPSTATSTTLVRFAVAVVRTPLQTRTRAYFWRRRITLVVVVVVSTISANNPGRLNPARPSPDTWIGRRVPVGPTPGRAPCASTAIVVVVVVIGIGHGCGPGADGIRVARRRRDAAVGAVFANADVHGVHAVRSPVGAAHSNVNAAIRKVGVAVVESS